MMVRPGSGRTLTLAVAAIFAATGIGLIAARQFRPAPPAPDDPCAERIVVYAADATPFDVVARRCESRPGGSPALLVATRDAALARDWRDALAPWAEGGRTTWFLVLDGAAPEPVGEAGGVAAAASALAEEAGVDPGRVALLASGDLAADGALDDVGTVVAATVVHEPRPADGDEDAREGAGPPAVLRVSGPVADVAQDARAFLARRLAVAPLAEPDAGGAPRN